MDLYKETEWIQYVLLRPDDYAVAEQDRQRRELLANLRRERLLDNVSQGVLEGPEALDEGWARPLVWGYHEGVLGLSDVTAEIGGLVHNSIYRGGRN